MQKEIILGSLRMLTADKEKRRLLSLIGISLAALAWLLLRTGTRWDRLRYPCQRVSLDLVLLGIPLLGSLVVKNEIKNRKWNRKSIGFLTSGILVVGIGTLLVSNPLLFDYLGTTLKPETSYAQNGPLTLAELDSSFSVSTIYLAQGQDPAHSLNSLLWLSLNVTIPMARRSKECRSTEVIPTIPFTSI